MAETDPTPKTAAQRAAVSNTELIRWAIERLSAKDLDSVRGLWTPTTVVYFPTETCRGPDAIAESFERLFQAFPDVRVEVRAIAESGDDVLVHWHLTGDHRGTILGIEATGRPVDLEGFDHFVIRDGSIVTNTVRYDQLEFARQIKLLPADGSMADRAMKTAFNAATRAIGIVRRR